MKPQNERAADAGQTFTTLFVDASGTLLRGSIDNPAGVELYPDAKPLLEAFAKRKVNNCVIKTGIITNWGNRIHRIVKSLGLEAYFDVVVCADDVPSGKPDPLIFQTACAWAGADVRTSFHIGDSLYDDALGATAAGLNALWIDRHQSRSTGFAEANLISGLPHPACADLTEAFFYLSKMIK